MNTARLVRSIASFASCAFLSLPLAAADDEENNGAPRPTTAEKTAGNSRSGRTTRKSAKKSTRKKRSSSSRSGKRRSTKRSVTASQGTTDPATGFVALQVDTPSPSPRRSTPPTADSDGSSQSGDDASRRSPPRRKAKSSRAAAATTGNGDAGGSGPRRGSGRRDARTGGGLGEPGGGGGNEGAAPGGPPAAAQAQNAGAPAGQAAAAGAVDEGAQGDPGEAQTILPEGGGIFRGKRVDILEGEIPVLEFLKFIADYTGLPVILDSTNAATLKNPITIAAKITGADAEIVKAILENNRWLVFQETLPNGQEIINVKSTQAAAPGQEAPKETKIIDVGKSGPSIVQGQLGRGDRLGLTSDELVTMIFTLKYTEPSEAINALNELISSGAKGAAARSKAFSVVEIPETMMLIITAKFGLIDYIEKLLTIIDVKVDEPERIVHIIEVKEADAQELVSIVNEFLEQRGGRTATPRTAARTTTPATATARTTAARSSRSRRGTDDEFLTRLIPDLRTQKIIVVTYSPQDFEDINMLVRELDTKFDIRRLRTRIYHMRFLKAVDVAPVIQDIIGSGGGTRSGRAGLGSRTGRTQSRLPRVSQTTRPPTTTTPAAGGQAGTLPTLVVPHEETNSLIIQAEQAEYQEIIHILSKIDVKRRQVFLEAALVQVTQGSELNYAIELLAGDPDDTATRLLAADFLGIAPIDTATFNRITPEQLPAWPDTPTSGLIALMRNGTFPALVRFFKGNTDTEVVATPFILADDNVQNTINITETRFVQNTNTVNQATTTSQQGEDAGITLDIFPTISSENAVFLEVGLEISAFAQGGGAALLPPKRTNSITSAVTISDSRTYVVGGLTREDTSKGVSKVPILGDIPLLGKLFRSESSTRDLSNLYIFLRAHILTDKNFRDLAQLTDQVLDDLRETGTEIPGFERPTYRETEDAGEDPDAPQTRFLDPSVPGVDERGSGRRGGPDYRGDVEGPDSPLPGIPGSYRERARPVTGGLNTPDGRSSRTGRTARAPEGRSTGRRRLPITSGDDDDDAANGDALEDWRRQGLEVDPEGESWFLPLDEKRGSTARR